MRYLIRTVNGLAWLYLAGAVAIGILLRTAGERWWPATVLLFAPRWVWAIPLGAFLPATAALALINRLGHDRRQTRRQAPGVRRQDCEQGSGDEKAEGTRQKAEDQIAKPQDLKPKTTDTSPKSKIQNSKSVALPVVLATVWVAWPLMGLCCSWSLVSSPLSVAQEGSGFRVRGSGTEDGLGRPSSIRVLTCNVGLEGYDEEALARFIDETMPDVVTLQEGYKQGSEVRVQGSVEENIEGRRQKAEEEASGVSRQASVAEGALAPSLPRPLAPSSSGWHVSAAPGIFLASRFPIVSQQMLQRTTDWGGTRTVGVAYQLDAPGGPFAFVALHLYTPRKGLMATPTRPWHGNEELELNTAWRAKESADVAKWVAGLPGAVIVAGDMNLTPESEIFRRDWSRYTDAFSAAGFGYGYTYGYRASRPFWGIRIDHVLADANWRVERCWVGPHIHSDHRPVVADIVREGRR